MRHQKKLMALWLVIGMILTFLPTPTLADEEMPPGMSASLLESDTDGSGNIPDEFHVSDSLDEALKIPDDAVWLHNHAYKAYTSLMTWEEAQEYFTTLGGHLVSITSQEEQDFVAAYAKTLAPQDYLWIGVKYPWNKWVTGELMTYANWGDGEPDSWQGQIYGVLSTTELSGGSYHIGVGQWDDWEGPRGYSICEWDAPNDSLDEALTIPENAVWFNGHAYAVIEKRLNPLEQEAYCESLGGYLVTITSPDEQNFITSSFHPSVYGKMGIGASDSASEGTWRWLNGEEMAYRNWEYDQPDNGAGYGQSYALIRYDSGEWDDYYGGWDNYEITDVFICEWGAPDGYVSGSPDTLFVAADDPDAFYTFDILDETLTIPKNALLFNGHAYALIEKRLKPLEQEAYCESLGGHLVTITSRDEQSFIRAFIHSGDIASRYGSLGIGASDLDSEGDWYWLNGEKMSYSNWDGGEPNNGLGDGQNYAQIYTQSCTWDDYYGGWDNYTDIKDAFICEWDGPLEQESGLTSVTMPDMSCPLYGSAAYLLDGVIELTGNACCQAGSVWQPNPFDGRRELTVSFDFRAFGPTADGGPGSDGMCLNLTALPGIGWDGSDLGFVGCGYGVELDSYYYSYNDPGYKHIAVIQNSVYEHLTYGASDAVNDGDWHNLTVSCTPAEYDGETVTKSGRLLVYLDGAEFLSFDGAVLNDRVYVGVSGATGGGTNYHWIKNFTVSGDEMIDVKSTPAYKEWKEGEDKTSFVVPEGVEFIGDRAFADCGELASVTIPDGVKAIESHAFENCTGLTSVSIPDGVTNIEENAFAGCTALTSVTLPDSVTTISSRAFEYCGALTSIAIPDSVTEIQLEAFTCSGLTSVTIPKGMITLNGFSSCHDLTSITIPNGVTTIGESAFANCSGLTSVTIPDSVTSIGNNAFCCTGLTSVTISNSVISIGYNAFSGCTGLTSITIPDSMTSIESNAFSGCTGLTAIEIPDSVTTIGSHAFSGCTGLTSVTLPSSLTALSGFDYCTGLTAIEILDSVTSIGNSAFSGCTGLTAIEIPDSVTTIGGYAFRGCTGLTAIDIPNSVTSIGWNAFEGCTGLTAIEIPDSVTTIGGYAFRGCTGLSSVTIPNSVTEIQWYTFDGCTSLKTAFLPESLSYIDWGAFEGCENLTLVVFPDSFAEQYAVDNGLKYRYVADSVFVTLSLKAPDGAVLTDGYSVEWTDESGERLASGRNAGFAQGTHVFYQVSLGEELSFCYVQPERRELNPGADSASVNEVCELSALSAATVRGRVTDEDGAALSGAAVALTLTANGRHSRTFHAVSGADGAYSVDAFALPGTLAVSADGYYAQRRDISLTADGDAVENFTLSLVPENRFTLSLIRTDAAEAGTEATQTLLSSADGLSFTVCNVTRNQEISGDFLQYPYLVLGSQAGAGDVIAVSVTDSRNSMTFAPTEAVYEGEPNQPLELTFLENGHITATLSGPENVRVMLFDGDGNFLRQYAADAATLDTGALPEGQYQLAALESVPLFSAIPDLKRLDALGLENGRDYVLAQTDAQNGVVSNLGELAVPSLDLERLSFLDAPNVSVTANKATVVPGGLVSVRVQYALKPRYGDGSGYLVLELPEHCNLYSGGVSLDGVGAAYTLDGRTVQIPVKEPSGVAVLYLSPEISGDYAVSCFLDWTLNDSATLQSADNNVLQSVGSASFQAASMQLNAPTMTSKSSVTVSGKAYSGGAVKVYDNGEFVGETTARAGGSWSLSVPLNGDDEYAHTLSASPDEDGEYSVHNLTAVVETPDGRRAVSDTHTVTRDKNMVELKSVEIIHGKTITKIEMDDDNLNPYYEYDPSNPQLRFVLTFSDNNSKFLRDVKVIVKDSDGKKQTLECKKQGIGWVAFYGSNSPLTSARVEYTCEKQSAQLGGRNHRGTMTTLNHSLAALTDSGVTIPNDLSVLRRQVIAIGYQLVGKVRYFWNGKSLSTAWDATGNILGWDAKWGNIRQVDNEYGVYGLDEAGFVDWVFQSVGGGENITASFSDANAVSFAEARPGDVVRYNDGSWGIVAQALEGPPRILRVMRCDRRTDGVFITGNTGANRNLASYLPNVSQNDNVRIYCPPWYEQRYNAAYERYVRDYQEKHQQDDPNGYMKRDEAEASPDWNWNDWLEPDEAEPEWVSPTSPETENEVLSLLNRKHGISEIQDPLRWKVIVTGYQLANRVHYFSGGSSDNSGWNADWGTITKDEDSKDNVYRLSGLDCSGFVRWTFYNASAEERYDIAAIYDKNNKKYKASREPLQGRKGGASREYSNCAPIEEKEAQPGDLAFYGDDFRHVGIVVGVDSSNKIQIMHCTSDPIKAKNAPFGGVVVTDNMGGSFNKFGRPYWYDANVKSQEITLTPIIDPSGYVCEAVPSNRLEGVTATVYCRYQNPDTEEMETVLWDAEEYDQTNPLTTDANGSYAWDVPIGEWQVRFEKDGYQSAASEWLPVPPPQTEVNAALVSNAVPQLSAASAYENEIRMEFSQYMRPETVNAERVHVTADGNAVPGEVLPVNLEASFDDPSISYASVYRFVPEIDLEGEIAITVDAAVENYAGAVMKEAATKTAFVERKPLSLSAPKNVEIDADSSKVVEVKVLPEGAGLNRKIIVSSSVPGMINAEDGMTDENGVARIPVTCLLPGWGELRFTLEGTELTTVTTVNYESVAPNAYVPPVTYALTVVNGIGGGAYERDAKVTIQADEPESGKRFKEWIGADSLTFTSGDIASTEATFLMPSKPLIMTAFYEDIPPEIYTLSVTGGSGSGEYKANAEVTIRAAEPESGKRFQSWSGAEDLTFISGSSATAEAVIQMPAHEVSITATYEEIPVFTVIWLNGDGKELDRKTYKEGQTEPTTDKVPTKAADADNTYSFSGWTLDKTEGNIKTYKPQFTATAIATYIETVSVNGQEIRAIISSSDSHAMIFCAIYSNSGKMIAVRSAQITGEANYQFQFDGQQFDYAKAFIVDSDFRPLCESKRS